MWVYGDGERREATAEAMARLRAGLAAIVPGTVRSPADLCLEGRIAGLLVAAGELAQGLLDEQLARLGEERWTPLSALCARLTLSLAESLGSSLDGAPLPDPTPALATLDEIAALDLPEEITIHLPEGYAHYGLYPEAYLRAAAALRGEPGPLHVLGIRSIGTGLAAAVAAGAGGAAFLATVRTVGHPFARRIDVGEGLARRLLVSGARYAVVDEGPGLSGSSFGGVADWLEDHGVPSTSIAFFPGHRGDLGPQATDRHRRRWGTARRLTADFDGLFLAPGAPLSLAQGVEELTGPAEAPLEDLSGGRWRERLLGPQAVWPAVHLQQERRKLLLRAGGTSWLLKFEGLGRYGEEALFRAEILARAGLAPPVAGLRHGFLVGPWLATARPLPTVPRVDRAALLDQVARHLAFLAERFPSPPGAAPETLLELSLCNTKQALGAEIAGPLAVWRDRLPGLIQRARPAAMDLRMHAWEWLLLPDGRILKSDALHHHRGNDLIGAQDAAWDLAGAAVELALSPDEEELLHERLLDQGATRATRQDLAFYTAAYLAFQLGHHTLAAAALNGTAEAPRLQAAADRYALRLRSRLTGTTELPAGGIGRGRSATV